MRGSKLRTSGPSTSRHSHQQLVCSLCDTAHQRADMPRHFAEAHKGVRYLVRLEENAQTLSQAFHVLASGPDQRRTKMRQRQRRSRQRQRRRPLVRESAHLSPPLAPPGGGRWPAQRPLADARPPYRCRRCARAPPPPTTALRAAAAALCGGR